MIGFRGLGFRGALGIGDFRGLGVQRFKDLGFGFRALRHSTLRLFAPPFALKPQPPNPYVLSPIVEARELEHHTPHALQLKYKGFLH